LPKLGLINAVAEQRGGKKDLWKSQTEKTSISDVSLGRDMAMTCKEKGKFAGRREIKASFLKGSPGGPSTKGKEIQLTKTEWKRRRPTSPHPAEEPREGELMSEKATVAFRFLLKGGVSFLRLLSRGGGGG